VVFRVHFECADLARTTIAQEPDPLWEVLLGLHVLQTDYEPETFGHLAGAGESPAERAGAGVARAGAAGGVFTGFPDTARSG
jgi:hypothetical protein